MFVIFWHFKTTLLKLLFVVQYIKWELNLFIYTTYYHLLLCSNIYVPRIFIIYTVLFYFYKFICTIYYSLYPFTFTILISQVPYLQTLIHLFLFLYKIINIDKNTYNFVYIFIWIWVTFIYTTGIQFVRFSSQTPRGWLFKFCWNCIFTYYGIKLIYIVYLFIVNLPPPSIFVKWFVNVDLVLPLSTKL